MIVGQAQRLEQREGLLFLLWLEGKEARVRVPVWTVFAWFNSYWCQGKVSEDFLIGFLSCGARGRKRWGLKTVSGQTPKMQSDCNKRVQ